MTDHGCAALLSLYLSVSLSVGLSLCVALFEKRVSFSVPLREDIAFFTDYLLQLVETKNLEQLWRVLRFLDRYNCNQPRYQGSLLPHPKGNERWETAVWSRVSEPNLSLRFKIFQDTVAASICHMRNRLCVAPGKLSFDFAAKLYHIYYIAYNIWNWVWKLQKPKGATDQW